MHWGWLMSNHKKKITVVLCAVAAALTIPMGSNLAYAASETSDTLATQISSSKSKLSEGRAALGKLNTASSCLNTKSGKLLSERKAAEDALAVSMKDRQNLEDKKAPLQVDYNKKNESYQSAIKESHNLQRAFGQANAVLEELRDVWNKCMNAPGVIAALKPVCAVGNAISNAAHAADQINQSIQENNKIVDKSKADADAAYTELVKAQALIEENQKAINSENKKIKQNSEYIAFISKNRGKIESLAFSMKKASTDLSDKIIEASEINLSSSRVIRLSRELSDLEKNLSESIEIKDSLFLDADSVLTSGWRAECKL